MGDVTLGGGTLEESDSDDEAEGEGARAASGMAAEIRRKVLLRGQLALVQDGLGLMQALVSVVENRVEEAPRSLLGTRVRSVFDALRWCWCLDQGS